MRFASYVFTSSLASYREEELLQGDAVEEQDLPVPPSIVPPGFSIPPVTSGWPPGYLLPPAMPPIVGPILDEVFDRSVSQETVDSQSIGAIPPGILDSDGYVPPGY
eukprot:CAMPEP_0114244596 /NCGR_PEP_ID=MMETSP0058-20121206/11427_1 /TAXON_ID=36894 /ORGANISM="Pyramimonas parkeae, CCMP726" /LENGTH=105 /DNA_ID=CAMNT_0001357553 /DNA_START=167 /DNA_END=482 /DNA_ORIENTATION=+